MSVSRLVNQTINKIVTKLLVLGLYVEPVRSDDDTKVNNIWRQIKKSGIKIDAKKCCNLERRDTPLGRKNV